MRQSKERVLNHKQKRFVNEYLIDFDPEKATLRAGYMAARAKKWAKWLMQQPHIQKAILLQKEEKNITVNTQEEIITQERILQELAAIGFASLTDICKWNAEGIHLLESSTLRREQIAAIAEITESSSGKGAVKIKTHAKLKALEMLAKYFGMFETEENKEINTFSKPILSQELKEQLDMLFPPDSTIKEITTMDEETKNSIKAP